MTSVVIPAHNEAGVLPRLLRGLAPEAEAGDLDVIVVCNGCTDATAEIARRELSAARVLEIADRSKTAALRAGDTAAASFPRIYLDADVEISGKALLGLAAALEEQGKLAAAPEVRYDLAGCPWLVRSGHRVLTRLPEQVSRVSGTGVIAISSDGRARFETWPEVTADDYWLDSLFEPGEKIRDSRWQVVVRPPRKLSAFLARRVRVQAGNRAVRRSFPRDAGMPADSTVASLFRIAAADPSMTLDVVAFAAVAALCRLAVAVREATGAMPVWQADGTSR